jgi:DNA polymerase-3 subunit beta
MKAQCHREGLLAACQLTSAAIPSKDLKPILKNLKAVAGEGRWTLLATDLEVGIRLEVPGLQILEPGEAILPAAKLISILREARDTDLLIEADSNACRVMGLSSPLEFEMSSEDPAQFPDFPEFTDEQYHEISAGSLRDMIHKTAFAAADETARYTMTGVLFELDGNNVRLVATDGRRLAMTTGIATGVGGHTTRGFTPIVPKKAMNLLERNLAADPEEVVKVCIRPNDVLFRTERAVIYSRLVDGRFPDYKGVIPSKTTVSVSLNAGTFHAAVRQAAIMTDNDSKRVTFGFTPDKLTLRAQGTTAGRSKVELPLGDYAGQAMEIHFNPDYLADMLKILPPDTTLELKMIDSGKPAVFQAGPHYTYLVMPLT